MYRGADCPCPAPGGGGHTRRGGLSHAVGVSEQTFSRWKRQFAGMGVVELRRLRQVEEENRKLKQLVADLSLDKHMLQVALRKKW
jgi:putative transposase